MLSLIQRVTQARVVVEGETVGAIGPGLLALVGVEPGDGEPQITRMAERLLGYRVFADEAGRMNWALADTGGGCCWSASSPWPPTPAAGCVRASARPPPRGWLNRYSTV